MRGKWGIATVVGVFALIYSSISLVNHLQFRTSALDLGMFNQAVYAYAHLRSPLFTLDEYGRVFPFLSCHFDPITALYAPLQFIFGSYTLLLIQIAAIILGGLGLYRYAKPMFANGSHIPLVLLIHFYSLWGIYSALAFDFHNNVIAAMLVPWLAIAMRERKPWLSLLLVLLILSTKEIMALWTIFVVLCFGLCNWQSVKSFFRLELPLMLLCLVYGIVVITVIQPWLQSSETNLQLSRYAHWGQSIPEVMIHIAVHPLDAIKTLCTNTLNNEWYDNIKQESAQMLLISGGFMVIFAPKYLIMIIPILLWKFMSNDYGFWGINSQYSIEFVPAIMLCVTDGLHKLKRGQLALSISACVLAAASTIFVMENRQSKWYDYNNTAFYSSKHYKPHINPASTHKALKQFIPADCPVSASSILTPHLYNRQHLYLFPNINNADYVAVVRHVPNYPINVEEANNRVAELIESNNYKVKFENKDIIILKRISLPTDD